MARPGLTQHRKFRRLARAVGSEPLTLGCLEFLWETCYQNGDDYLGDVLDVEAAAHWDGEQGKLCTALLTAGGDGNRGFIDELDGRPGHYRCHDLFDHAPRFNKLMIVERPQLEWLDLKALQGYACVSERTLREWIHRGANPLPAARVGTKILVRRSTFDQWLENHRLKTIDVGCMVDELIAGLAEPN